MNTERNRKAGNKGPKEDDTSKPDPGTLHNTDPQENMEGPVSSFMHDTGEQFDTEQTKGEADKEIEEGM